MQHLGVGWVGRDWEHQATWGDDVTPNGAVGSLMATGGRQKHSAYASMCVCVLMLCFVAKEV